jgi:outer membrane protein assembly factor BamD
MNARRYRPAMSRRLVHLILLAAIIALCPLCSPAPFVFTPGQGWTYEPVGGVGRWKRERAKDQLDVAHRAFDDKNISLASSASLYLLRTWPLSDYAPDAQYLYARCLEAEGKDEKAFEEYQKMFDLYPKSEKLKEVFNRQYQIAMRYLNGQRFKIWGMIPFLPNMDKTAGLFEKIVETGPYSEIAPHAQLRVGAAREKQKSYPEAVAAYERAADRYNDKPVIAADALYRAGISLNKQAQTAEYDQGTAGRAISTFTDLIALYPEDKRVPEAKKIIASLKNEQARGNFKIAEFYSKRKQWNGAIIYYNEVLLSGVESPLATVSRERIDQIKQFLQSKPN